VIAIPFDEVEDIDPTRRRVVLRDRTGPARRAARPCRRRGQAPMRQPPSGRRLRALAARWITHDDLVASWQRALDAADEALQASLADHALSPREGREFQHRLAAERSWLAGFAIARTPFQREGSAR
jgi:hypothetical protein